MNKSELIEQTAQVSGLSRKAAGEAVAAMLDIMARKLAEGEPIQIKDFGTFEVKEWRARTGRNPRTGETIPIPASRQPVFHPGKGLKEQVNRR